MTESCTNKRLRVLDIIDGTIVDGPGLRTSIYFAGCGHKCQGCHNQQSWPFDAGTEMSVAEIMLRIEDNDMDVTLSGGDPLYQIDGMVALARAVKQAGRNLWCYTGFNYEEICQSPRLSPILEFVDVIVDGPYVEAQRDLSLRFRGSRNQRLIDAKKSTPENVVEWHD